MNYQDQINFFCRGQLPPVPKYLEDVYKIAAKANKLGIEYCGKSIISVQKEIELYQRKVIK
jgi:hypothetical protein